MGAEEQPLPLLQRTEGPLQAGHRVPETPDALARRQLETQLDIPGDGIDLQDGPAAERTLRERTVQIGACGTGETDDVGLAGRGGLNRPCGWTRSARNP